MFSQSITIKLFKYIGSKLKVCSDKFKTRLLHGLFLSFVNTLSIIYKKSFLNKYIESSPIITLKWSESFLAKFADKLYMFITNIIVAIFNFIKKISAHSTTYDITKKIAQKISFHQALGIIFALIFLVYSSLWNNLYAAFIAIILVLILIYKDKGISLKPSKIDFFMVLFVISIVLGIFVARNKVDAIRIALIVISALLFHLCTISSLNTYDKLKDFTKILCFGVFLTAIIAIGQRVIGIEVDPEFVDIETNAGMPGRVFSTMENPNNYAELLVMFMPFMYALFFVEEKRNNKIFWGIAVVLTFIALAMTYSRSCYIAIAIATIIFILIYDYKLILPVLFIALCAIPLLPETVFNRILTIGSLSDSSNSYRLYIWEVCINLISNYGVSGIGIGPESFRMFYRPLSYERAISAPHSHMLYMELILEYGIVGFIGFMGYYIRLIRNGFKSIKFADKSTKAYLGAGIGALIGISFVCTAEYIWFYPRDMFAHFIVMGMLSAIIKIISKERSGVVK